VDIGFGDQVTKYVFALYADMTVIPEQETFARMATGIAGIA